MYVDLVPSAVDEETFFKRYVFLKEEEKEKEAGRLLLLEKLTRGNENPAEWESFETENTAKEEEQVDGQGDGMAIGIGIGKEMGEGTGIGEGKVTGAGASAGTGTGASIYLLIYA